MTDRIRHFLIALLSLAPLLLGLTACGAARLPGAPATASPAVPMAIPSAAPTETPAPATAAALPQPISYLRDTSAGITELHLMIDETDRVLAVDQLGFASLQWSPDGRMGLAAVKTSAERALVLIDIPGASTRRLVTTVPEGVMQFRPADSWTRALVLEGVAGSSRIWAVNLEDGSSTRLLESPGRPAEWQISADGRWAIIGAEAGGEYTTLLYDLGDMPALVAYEISDIPHPVSGFSPDGRWLALAGQPEGEELARLLLYDMQGADPAGDARVIARGDAILPLSDGSDAPASFFSADGRWLTAEIRRGAESRLYLRSLDEDMRAEMPLAAGEEVAWVSIPPGMVRALVVTRGGAGMEGRERLHLWFLDLDADIPLLEGAERIILLTGWVNGVVAVQADDADGRVRLAFVDVPKGSSYIRLRGMARPLAVDIVGRRVMAGLGRGGMEDIHVLDVAVGGTAVYMGFSAGDETRLARGAFAPFGPAALAVIWREEGYSQLVVSDGSGRTALPAANNVEDAWFAPAGQWVLFTRALEGSEGGIFVVGVNGKDMLRLAEGYAPRWHPSGR